MKNMNTLLEYLKTSTLEGVHDGLKVAYINVLGLSIAYFFVPKSCLLYILYCVYGALTSDKAGFYWIMLLSVILALKWIFYFMLNGKKYKGKKQNES